MKLVGKPPPDAAGIRLHGAEVQPQSGEYPAVGLVHLLVAFLQRVLVEMKGIGIFHDKFPRPHDAEARPYFIAELALDLIEHSRELTIAADFPPHQVGDDFFVGRTETEEALVSVLQTQQLRSVLVPAAGFLPEFGGLYCGHEDFLRPATVHLLTDDTADLMQHPQTQRQPGVKSGGKTADHTGPQHQLMADDFGIGRCFFERG